MVRFRHAGRSLPLGRSDGEHPSRGCPHGTMGQSDARLVDDAAEADAFLQAVQARMTSARMQCTVTVDQTVWGLGFVQGASVPAGGERPDGGLTDPAAGPVTIAVRYATLHCRRNIEMAPLCNIEMALSRVSGSREQRHDGAVDEQAGIQPA
jgi:hypothetical protein